MMLVLVTDFGPGGPYMGQMQAVLQREAPGVPAVTLFNDAPRCNPRASAYLLAAYAGEFPPGSVFVAVIDPGVGTASRRPVIVEADGRWYVGPDNGLFELITRRAALCRCWEITWRPAHLSASFHGRDLFAPVAARLARGERPPGMSVECSSNDWPDDLAEVIYIDHFGNAMTGLRAATVAPGAVLSVAGRQLHHAVTFGAVAAGEAFWYENANGLVELAINQGCAAQELGLSIGTSVAVQAVSH
ncbi:MAG: SAM-dependent chlorinase/fluorinase [Pseudomonadota bacterium]